MGMTQQEQAMAVRLALELEKRHKKEEDNLRWTRSASFGLPPAQPQRLVAPAVKYPEPDPNFTFDWICFLVNLLGISAIVIGLPFIFVPRDSSGIGMLVSLSLYVVFPAAACLLAKKHILPVKVCGYLVASWLGYIIFYRVMKRFLTEETRNSAEYRKICADLDDARDQQQLGLDRQYEEELSVYNNETMPKYNREKAAWMEKHKREVAAQTEIYEAALNEMNQFYDTTRIIPQQYHDIPALEYLDSLMSSSEYDIMAAIDSYERQLARDLEMQRIREQQIANEMAEAQNQLLYEQNSQLQQQNQLQEERNMIAERARRDQRNAAIVNAVQNHNRNKYLKNR